RSATPVARRIKSMATNAISTAAAPRSFQCSATVLSHEDGSGLLGLDGEFSDEPGDERNGGSELRSHLHPHPVLFVDAGWRPGTATRLRGRARSRVVDHLDVRSPPVEHDHFRFRGPSDPLTVQVAGDARGVGGFAYGGGVASAFSCRR